MISPLTHLLILEGSKHVKQGPIEMLNGVPSRMIGHSSYFLGASELAQLFYDPGLKVGPLNTMEFLKEP